MKSSSKLLLLLVILLLSGCFGSYYEPEPVGVGKGGDELKLSPCACRLNFRKLCPTGLSKQFSF